MDASPNADRVAFLLNQLKGLREDLAGAATAPERADLEDRIECLLGEIYLAGCEEMPA